MNYSRTVAVALVSALLALPLFGLWPGTAPAAEDPEHGRTPPRLSFYDGEVSFWRPGADDWAPARLNLPLAPGDALYTGAGANLELQIGALAFVRAGELTQLSLANQEPGFVQLTFGGGHLAVDVHSLPRGHVIEVDTPGAAVVLDRAGYYRFRVTDERTSIIARRGGRATVTPAEGEPRVIMGGERVTIDARDRFVIDEAPDSDVWDQWNYDRTDQVADAASGRYVPPGVYGAESLERYGTWQNVPTYGRVWAPRVEPGWVPYSTGSWIWDSYYGWTWVDDAPWGWAPAHYGRWVYVNSYWAWAPGPVIVTPFYAPAVVAFFGGGVGVSVGFGFPALSWVALGWGEPLYPWWGPVGFIGRPCWYGWGGPRWHGRHGHDDHHRHDGHNGHDRDYHGPHDYQNGKVHNAILAADKGHFGHGPVSGTRVPPNQVSNLAPVGGKLPVKPVPASFAPQQGPTVRPPDKGLAKPVVATRQAHDPSPSLQAAGVAAPASAPRRPARVVSAPPQSAPRSAPAGGTADSIDRSPVSAPRGVDAPRSAPPASGRSSGSVGGGRPSVGSDAPVSGPRSAPAGRAPAAPPMSAPRQQERDQGGSGSAPTQQMPPAQGSRGAPRGAERVQPPAPPQSAPRQGGSQGSAPAASQPRSSSPSQPQSAPREAAPSRGAPRGAERVQPPAPPRSAPRQGGSQGSAPAASQPRSSSPSQPRSAPREAAPSSDNAPASAPGVAPPADRPSRAPSSGGYSAPPSGSVNRGYGPGGGSSTGRPSSGPRGGGYGGPSGGAYGGPRSGGYGGPRGGGYGGPSGGASSAPRGSGSLGGGSRSGGGGVGSGPRH